jgi:tetratricopeptide (TPR) repeat protein
MMGRLRLFMGIAVLPVVLIVSAACVAGAGSTDGPGGGGLVDLETQARAKMTAEQWTEAADLWRKLTDANPTMPRYWDQLGHSSLRAKDYKSAISAFQRAFELGAGYPFNAAYNIACGYALMGEKEQALEWLGKSLDMGFRNLQDVRTDDDLKSLRGDARFIKLAALDDVTKMTRDQGWRYDLWLLSRELKRIHYDPFKRVSREEFDGNVKKLHDEIPKLRDAQIEVEFMKLARMMGDGHTTIRPGHAQSQARLAAPVEFYKFAEGLFVTRAAPKYADLVGAQVLKIGEHSVEKVYEALDPVISQDNKMWPLFIGANMMRYPRALNGLGLIREEDRMSITVRDPEGQVRTLTLVAEPGGPADDWPSARKSGGRPEPLFLKDRRTNYWFEYLPESRTVFFQYNAVQHIPKDPLPEFCDRLFKFINEHDVERLVIDMRWNSGGNNFLNRPIVHGLIRNDKINQRGKLFVIVGRQTFSAAMNGAAEIERNTNAIFVGEPTGSSPNFVGESIPVNLPYSKMGGSISDLYWQSSVAMDYRTWISPLLYAPPSFALYASNRDPAMEAIMAYAAAGKTSTEPAKD